MSSFEIKYRKIRKRGSLDGKTFQDSIRCLSRKYVSTNFLRSSFGQRSLLPPLQTFPPRDGSPFPIRRSLLDFRRGNAAKESREFSVNSRIVEGGGREIKIYIGSNARWIGIRAISFRKRNAFFRYFPGNFGRLESEWGRR